MQTIPIAPDTASADPMSLQDAAVIQKLIADQGFLFGSVEISDITFHSDYREICRQNVCRCYGTTWACPPGVGTEEECIARMRSYDKMILFSKVYELEDSFDIEGMQEGGADFRSRVERLSKELNQHVPRYLMMANGGCHKCDRCTYPDAPCRYPDQVFHSLSSYMFTVSAAAKLAGLTYNNGPNTVTYFGALLW